MKTLNDMEHFTCAFPKKRFLGPKRMDFPRILIFQLFIYVLGNRAKGEGSHLLHQNASQKSNL